MQSCFQGVCSSGTVSRNGQESIATDAWANLPFVSEPGRRRYEIMAHYWVGIKLLLHCV
jgi:hypothetical protein